MKKRMTTPEKMLLLLGTFSMTQIKVIGSVGISELVIIFLAPYMFVNDYAELRRDGFLTTVWLSLFMVFGCCIASWYNHTPFAAFIRGFAAPLVLFSALVVGHHLVRRAPNGYKWFCLGVALSWLINTFVFQRSVEYDAYAGGVSGLAAASGVMSSPIYWTGRLEHWSAAVIQGWFYKCPTWFCIIEPIVFAAFSMLTTASGRSTAVTALAAAALAYLAGKKIAKMRLLQKSFWLLLIAGMIGSMVLTSLYKYAAVNNWLGEEAYQKYVSQMTGREKQGVLGVLMGGRIEFFAGLYANCLNPIIGYGPWPVDENGIYRDFLFKYGTAEDVQKRLDYEKYLVEWHVTNRVEGLPAHSHIMGQWTWYGISGFLFWVYVIVQLIRYFRKDLATVPQWFGMLALATPSMLWSIFFSPLGDRVPEAMFIVLLMMTRAIRQGRVRLPYEMVAEIQEMERKK